MIWRVIWRTWTETYCWVRYSCIVTYLARSPPTTCLIFIVIWWDRKQSLCCRLFGQSWGVSNRICSVSTAAWLPSSGTVAYFVCWRGGVTCSGLHAGYKPQRRHAELCMFRCSLWSCWPSLSDMSMSVKHLPVQIYRCSLCEVIMNSKWKCSWPSSHMSKSAATPGRLLMIHEWASAWDKPNDHTRNLERNDNSL